MTNLKSKGYDNFNGQLTHNCGAHPRVDRKTGELFVFGYDVQKPWIHLSVFDKNKIMTKSMDIEITNARMIHDFMISEKYLIVPDLPMEFDPVKAVM